jgi:hypothetical protein
MFRKRKRKGNRTRTLGMDERARTCGECGKALESPLRCSRCRARWYCSAACKRANWPRHKSSCHAPAAAPPPSASSVVSPAPALAAATSSQRPAGMPRVGHHEAAVTQVDRSAGTRRDLAPDPVKFPSQLRVFSFVPSPDGLNENLLVLLHGLGASSLPSSASCSITGCTVMA